MEDSHSSLIKALNLIDLLAGHRKYTAKEIIEKLDISERTFSRYIKTLRDYGFVVEYSDGFYKIPKNSKAYNSISDLLHFSEEESYILNEAIHNIEASTKARQNLIAKLSALYDSDRIAIQFTGKENSSKIKPLLDAVHHKTQVILHGYSSSAGGNVSDRLVEPFEITNNYIALWAYEPASSTNKLFKISRIRTVEKLQTAWQHTRSHKANFLDCFRVGGEVQIPIKFRMTLKAKNLLTEEYPLSESMVERISDNDYVFDGVIASFDGIARFMLGLPGEISALDHPELTEFLRNKQKLSKII